MSIEFNWFFFILLIVVFNESIISANKRIWFLAFYYFRRNTALDSFCDVDYLYCAIVPGGLGWEIEII